MLNNIEQTSGNKKQVLTAQQLPTHYHTLIPDTLMRAPSGEVVSCSVQSHRSVPSKCSAFFTLYFCPLEGNMKNPRNYNTKYFQQTIEGRGCGQSQTIPTHCTSPSLYWTIWHTWTLHLDLALDLQDMPKNPYICLHHHIQKTSGGRIKCTNWKRTQCCALKLTRSPTLLLICIWMKGSQTFQ